MSDVVISEFMDKETAEGLIAEYDVHWDPNLWDKRAELLEKMADDVPSSCATRRR